VLAGPFPAAPHVVGVLVGADQGFVDGQYESAS
jgi:hypothetical protein